jgi:hypothetical protein
VLRVTQVHKELRDHRVLREVQEHKVRLDLKETLVHKVPKVIQVLKGIRVLKVP